MDVVLKTGLSVSIRLLEKADASKLLDYLSGLSAETRSRFGPHSFDQQTIEQFFTQPDEVLRYIAISKNDQRIIAYMLFKKGMIYWDDKRYTERNQHYNHSAVVTFAPSVADAFQNSGLGSVMYETIEAVIKASGFQYIILWGGVQASNQRAVHFYEKHGYEVKGSFWHDEKDNFDMVKRIG